MSKQIEVSAKLVIRVGDRVLMLRRKDGSNIFPGGHVEYGESINDCLKREALEELSYTLEIAPEYFSMYEYIASDGAKHALILHYLLVLPSRQDFLLGDDEAGSELIWHTREDLAKIIPDAGFIRKAFAD